MANIYRIEYETNDFNYKVHIAADSFEKARDFLFKNVKKQLRINSMSELCRIDAITREAIPQIIIEENHTHNIKNLEKETIGQENKWKCPWCGETFEKEMGLKIHIGRQHK
jgi:rubrerythrin